jgi:hypothetical protein
MHKNTTCASEVAQPVLVTRARGVSSSLQDDMPAVEDTYQSVPALSWPCPIVVLTWTAVNTQEHPLFLKKLSTFTGRPSRSHRTPHDRARAATKTT